MREVRVAGLNRRACDSRRRRADGAASWAAAVAIDRGAEPRIIQAIVHADSEIHEPTWNRGDRTMSALFSRLLFAIGVFYIFALGALFLAFLPGECPAEILDAGGFCM